MRTTSWRLWWVLPVAGLLFGACFSDRSGAAPPTDPNLCDSPGTGVVVIRNFAFQPAELRVPRGTRVTWVNCDNDAHTSTADNRAWDSPLLARGATFSHTFDTPGRVAYHCEPHPFMTAAVVVE
jgi:plastocyanin